MDDASTNKLYGWKGRVHKAIQVFKQCKIEYVRVCALPKTKNALLKTVKGTTCNYDADIALTWILLESSRKVVDATCDGYIASIRRSFSVYQKKQEETALAPPPTTTTATATATATARTNTAGVADTAAAAAPVVPRPFENENDTTVPAITVWIEGVVENTINSHVKFIQQWRDIIGDAQKEVAGWKSEHEKYLN